MESLGDVRRLAGDLAKADEAYRVARKLLTSDPVTSARLLLKEARISHGQSRYTEAMRRISRGRKLLEGVEGDEAGRWRAQLSVWYATMRQTQGHHADAIRWCRRAIAEAEASGERDALAHAYVILDWAFVSLGKDDDENQCSKLALDIYTELGDLTGQALVLNNLGAYAYFEGRWNEAVDFYERGRLARESTGDPVNAAFGVCNVGEILSDQGRQEDAEPLVRHALRVWKAAGDAGGVAFAQGLLGRVAARSGRLGEALELYEHARAGYHAAGDSVGIVEIDTRITEALIFRGDGDEALELIEETLAKGDAGVHALTLRRLRGYALMQLGRLEDARRALDESLEGARARKASYEEALTLRAITQLAEMEGSPDEGAAEAAAGILAGLGVVSVTDPAGIPAPRSEAKLPV
jgi:tetratricopeptide (TPR) repeat protein